MKKTVITILSLLLYVALFAQQVPNVKNSWLGQDSPFTASFVPQGMEGMCVGADGTAYTNVPWEEGGGNFAEIKNGVVNHGEASHGWGAGGGSDVASNSTYVYWAMYMGNEGGGLVGSGAQIDRWPAAGRNWLGVTRRLKSDVKQGATFAGGKGWPLNSMLVALDYPDGDLREPWINGLHATETELFVSIGSLNIVKVYNAATMVFLREFSAPNPHQIATDSWGKIWVAQGFDATTINRYNPDGSLLPEAINLPTGSFVGDFCIGADDKMYIGDVGRREQVLIYTTINTYPRETGTFGAMYGIHSGISGRNAPLKFQQIRGIGLDNSGNIYVGNTQWHTGGQGTLVEKYNIASGTMAWKATCVMFVDACGLDALTEGQDAYGKVERFSIDYSKPVGQEAQYVAYTIDRYKYPADPRLWQSMANVQTINFRGKKFLAMMDMTGRIIALFRFNKDTDGEIAIPCIVWGERVNPNYPGSIDKQWIWRDTDGDGQMEAGEYTQQDTYFIDGGRGTYFDTNGDIWQAGWQNLLVNKCLGLDANGIPFYNGSRTLIPAPVPFNDVKRSYYDPILDRMYIGGRTINEPDQFDWMTMGRAIVRYDNWSTGNRVAQSELRLPYSNNGGIADPISFCVVKDYIFVCFVGGDNIIPRQQINIYRVSDNSYVGYIRPIFSDCGLFDMNQSINVSLRKNGEYVIVAEENGRNKNLLYRWCPDGTCVETPDIVVANNNYIGFPHPQSTNVLSVTSNVNWTFTGIPSWLTLNTLTGNGNKIINFTASANLGPSRTAEITLTGGGVLWNKITVFQQVDDLSAPTNVTTVFGTFIDVDKFILNWTESTDNVMVVGYEVYKDNILVRTVPGLNTVINGLIPSTNYNMKVIAFDERGNKLAGTSKIIRTKNITYPYITSKDHANYNVDENAFDGVTWTYWKDWEIQSWIQIQYEFPVVWNKYTLWNLPAGEWTIDDDPKDWVLVGSNDGVTYTTLSTQAEQMWSSRGSAKDFYFTNTIAYTRYKFVFNAVRGGRSVGLGEIIFDNAPLVDTESPTVPTALSSSQITPNTANLSWQPSTDNVGVFGYEIFRNGVSIGSSTGTNFEVTGLTPSTAYTFTVRAYDFKGNFSPQSASTTFTTRVAPTLSISLNNLNFIAAGGSQSISVTSNGIWTVSGLPTWLAANPATDYGNAPTSIVATVNPNLGARSCVITISSWAAMAFVTITQDGTLPLLVVNPVNLTYASAASAQTLSITSNINWTVSGLPTWLSVSTSSGFGSKNIAVNTQLNSIAVIRIAQVTFTGGALTQIVNITQTGSMPAPNLMVSKMDITNCGGTGTITLTGSGGALPYQFSLDNFATISNSPTPSFVFSNLAAGTYTGYIRNSISPFYGSSIAGIVITTPVLPNIVTVTATDISNCGLVDGSIYMVANQGTGILEYNVNNSWTTNASVTGLFAGLYSLIVRNQNSPACSVSGIGNININQPNTPSNLNIDNILQITQCNGSLGTIVLSATFATQSDLRFSLDGITWTNTNGTFTGLAASANTYKAMVRNVNAPACSVSGNNFIIITAPIAPGISASATNIAECSTPNGGSITITGTGGTETLEYSNGGAFQAFPIFANLAIGNYKVEVRNVNSPTCSAAGANITITSPVVPTITGVSKTDVLACGSTNGSITINATGVNGALEYSKDGGTNWVTSNNVFNGLGATTITAMVRNQNSPSCKATAASSVTITVPSAPNVSVSATQRYCLGGNAILTATGVNGFTWLPNTALSAIAGNSVTASPTATIIYSVTGTNGSCSETKTVQVVVNALPAVSATSNAICQGQTATVTANGATTYIWNSTSTGSTFITNANYVLIGKDRNNCTNTFLGTVIVNAIPAMPTAAVATPANMCVGNGTMVFGAIAPTGATLQWYDANGNESPFNQIPTIATNIAGRKIAFVSSKQNGCESQLVSILGIIEAQPSNVFVSYLTNVFCSNDPIAVYNVNPLNPIEMPGATFATNANVGNGFLDANSGALSIANVGNAINLPITITVTGTATGSCTAPKATLTITVTGFKGKPSIAYNSKYCKEDTAILPNATLLGIAGEYTAGTATNVINKNTGEIIAGAGVYQIYYKTLPYDGCSKYVDSDISTITIVSPSVGNIYANKDKICAGDSILLSTTFTGDALTWKYITKKGTFSDGTTATLNTSKMYENREYFAEVSMASCTNTVKTATQSITVYQPSTFSGIKANLDEICSETSTEVHIADAVATDFEWYQATTSSSGFSLISALETQTAKTETLHTPKLQLYEYGKDTYYKAILKNGNCPAIETPVIQVRKCKIGKYTPNAFKPSENGENSYWDLSGLRLIDLSKVSIFNRYGQEVFSATGKQMNDIKFEGNGLPAGTYYYVIERNDGSKENSVITGDLTVIK